MPMIEPGWQAKAKCRELGLVDLAEEDQEPEMRTLADQLFFVGQGGKTGQAKSFCSDCLSRRSCLNYAVLYETKGFWAGTSEKDRSFYPPEFQQALYDEAVYYDRLENHDIESMLQVFRDHSSEFTQQTVEVQTKEIIDFSIRDTIDSARDFLRRFDSVLSTV